MTDIRVSAFKWVPRFAQGLVRDLRVRWALEEAGRPYEERLIGFEDQDAADYRRLQPFGQVPAAEIDGLSIFESGAIVLHIAEASDALMPKESASRAQVVTWMFSALNSVEPPILTLNTIDMQRDFDDGKGALRAVVLERIEKRLDAIVAFLGDRPALVGESFSAADLLMTTVLRLLRNTDLVTKRPPLAAYQQRHEARPAFGKALAAQLAAFEKHAPKQA